MCATDTPLGIISQITNLTITTDVLLFDTDEASDEVNITIFKTEQKYI